MYSTKERDYKYNKISVYLGICLIFICGVIAITDAALEVNGYTNGNSIYWNWTDESVQYITIDGIIIENFDNNSLSYQYTFDKDIRPTMHTIGIHNNIEHGYNTSLTNFSDNSSTQIIDFFATYLFVFAIIIILAISVIIKRPEICLVAFMFCLIGYSINGIDNILHPEMGIVYVVCFLGCLFFGLLKD